MVGGDVDDAESTKVVVVLYISHPKKQNMAVVSLVIM